MFSPFLGLRSLLEAGNVSCFLLFAVCGHFRNRECIFFSPFGRLQSLSDPGVYLFFSFWQIAVTFESGSVSFFLLFAICGHFLVPEMYLTFSFSQFAVTSWCRKCILFSPFRDLQSLFRTGIASAFLLLVICSHILTPGVYPIFSFSQSAVTLVPENSAESLPNKKKQQKTIFSFNAAVFRQ